MNLEKKFDEPALVAYVVAGDPNVDATIRAVETLDAAGASIIELGLPFSDPIADGPTIQAGIDRALRGGMNPDRYFELAESLEVDAALVCMTYYNLIFKRGVDRFIRDCARSNIEGIIVPDLPVEEAGDLLRACKKHGVDPIFLVAPTTSPARLKKVGSAGSGFLYLIARLGVTGARTDVSDQTRDLLNRVGDVELPKAVGFGISTPAQAREIVQAGADGVIVGSAFVERVSEGDYDGLERLASGIKTAITP